MNPLLRSPDVLTARLDSLPYLPYRESGTVLSSRCPSCRPPFPSPQQTNFNQIAGSLCCTAQLPVPTTNPTFQVSALSAVEKITPHQTPPPPSFWFLALAFKSPPIPKHFQIPPGIWKLFSPLTTSARLTRSRLAQNTQKPNNPTPTTDHISTMDFSNQGRACFTCEFSVAVSSLWLLFAPRL